MKIKILFPLLFALLSIDIGSAEEAALNDLERAKMVVGRHLLALTGSAELTAAVASGSLRKDSYWKNIFPKDEFSRLFPLIKGDLSKAMDDVPLAAGRRVSPEVYVRTVLKGLDPLPLVSFNQLTAADQKKVLAFAEGPLHRFSSIIYRSDRDFDAAIADVALEAASAFHSSLISGGFNKLGTVSADVRLKQNEIELIDAKDRLNSLLHLWGLHLVLDGEKLADGRINLSAYLIEKKFSYDICGNPFSMYEVKPVVEHEFYPALGHAENENGFLFLFAANIDAEVFDAKRYLTEAHTSFLTPSAAIDSGSILAIDALVRDGVSLGEDLRSRFIDTVGHHEGYHKYIEPVLQESVKRRDIGEKQKYIEHEAGAYLYQLESSNDNFTMFDLLMIFAAAVNQESGFSANKNGAKETLSRLAESLSIDRSDPVNYFKLSPSKIKSAAAMARKKFEMEMGGFQPK